MTEHGLGVFRGVDREAMTVRERKIQEFREMSNEELEKALEETQKHYAQCGCSSQQGGDLVDIKAEMTLRRVRPK